MCASACCGCTFVWRGVEISLCMLTVQLQLLYIPRRMSAFSPVCSPTHDVFFFFSIFDGGGIIIIISGGLMPAAASCLSHSESGLIETWKSPHTEEDCCRDLWLWVLSLVE